MKIKQLLSVLLLGGLTSCTSIDCSLDSVVVWTLTFYDSETDEPLKLPCQLSIDASGAGTLFNRGLGVSSMALPMSYVGEADTLFLRWSVEAASDPEGASAPYEVTDILTVSHDNYPHFDAIDCPAAVFHTITDAAFTTHSFDDFPVVIDSVRIIRPQVDYHDVENIRLFLHVPGTADVPAPSAAEGYVANRAVRYDEAE